MHHSPGCLPESQEHQQNNVHHSLGCLLWHFSNDNRGLEEGGIYVGRCFGGWRRVGDTDYGTRRTPIAVSWEHVSCWGGIIVVGLVASRRPSGKMR